MLLVTVTLLMLPVSYHHLVGHGAAPMELNTFATGVMTWALLAFAASIGVALFIVTVRVGHVFAIAVSVTATLIALFLWYGPGVIAAI